GHVRVTDTALRRGQVLRGDVEVVDRVVETVLDRTELRAGLGDRVDRDVDRRDGRAGAVHGQGVDRECSSGHRADRDGDDVVRRGVGADLERARVGAVEELLAVELRGGGDAVEL